MLATDLSRSSSLTSSLDLLYGSLAGGTLLALELYALELLPVSPSLGSAAAVAVGWAVALLVLTSLVTRAVRDAAVDREAWVHLAAFHLAYGPALGLWIRLSWTT